MLAGKITACYILPAMRKKDMITTREFSDITKTPYATVARWAQSGVIPGAHREETLRGPVWLIPRSAVTTFEEWKPKMGRPRS
jgi:hypothetical protein